jgi:hypothetical protein
MRPFVALGLSFACVAACSHPNVLDETADESAGGKEDGIPSLVYGQRTPTATYRGKPVTYKFSGKQFDAFTLVVTTALGDPKPAASFTLSTLGKAVPVLVDAQMNGDFESRAQWTLAGFLPRSGSYRITYTGLTGSSYAVDLSGSRFCHTTDGTVSNPACPTSQRCFANPGAPGGVAAGICEDGAPEGLFCITSRPFDCADGLFCEPGHPNEDEGTDGICVKCPPASAGPPDCHP